MPVLALDSAIWVLAGVCALSVVGLLLIVVAPWRKVREEPPLDEEVQTRLLLGEDPQEIAEDVDEEESERASVAELRPEE